MSSNKVEAISIRPESAGGPLTLTKLQELRYRPGNRGECDNDIRQVVRALAEEHITKGTKFVDEDFTADITSLLRHPRPGQKPVISPMPHEWKRLPELDITLKGFPDEEAEKKSGKKKGEAAEDDGPRLFAPVGPEPEDVVQGNLGSCFLLGAFSVLAAESAKRREGKKESLGADDILQSIVVEHDVKAGIYGMRFFQNGLWRAVVIDDFIPVVTGSTGKTKGIVVPNFGWNSDPKDMWVALVEKAYAKLYHCYEHLEGGVGRHALEDLTGGVARRIRLDESSQQRLNVGELELRTQYAFKKRWGGAETGGEKAPLLERQMWGPSSNGMWKILLSRPDKKAKKSEDNTHLLPEKNVSCEFSLQLKQGQIRGGGVLRFVAEEGLITVVKINGTYTMSGDAQFEVHRVAGKTSPYDNSKWSGKYHKQVEKVGSTYLAVIFSQLEDLVIDFGEGEIKVPRDDLFGGGVLKEKFPSYVTAFDSFFDELFLKSQAGAVMSVVLEDPRTEEEIEAAEAKAKADGTKYKAEEADPDTGLLRDHAYGIVNVLKIQGYSMLQLRNPHAHGQWLGKYGDQDPNWPKKLKKKLRVKDDEDDGIFWMNYQQFIDTWSFVDVCRVFNEQDWNVVTEQGSFYEQARCGGAENWADNPQYRLMWESSRVISFVVRLSQPDTKIYSGEDMYPVSVGVKIVYGNHVASRMLEHVVRSAESGITDEELGVVERLAQELTIADTVLVDELCEPNQRSVSLEVSLAPRGADQPYLIVPYTTTPNVTLPYILNVYGNAPFTLSTDFEGGGPIEADSEDPSEGSEDEELPGTQTEEVSKAVQEKAGKAKATVDDAAEDIGALVFGMLEGIDGDEDKKGKDGKKDDKKDGKKDSKKKDDKKDGKKEEVPDTSFFGTVMSGAQSAVKDVVTETIDLVDGGVAHDASEEEDIEPPGDEYFQWFYGARYDVLMDMDEMSEAGEEAEAAARTEAERQNLPKEEADAMVAEAVRVARAEARQAALDERASAHIGAYVFGNTLKNRPVRKRGEHAKSHGRNVKARGRNIKARGRNVKARGRNVKARGRNVKARGRNVKARGRNVKARGRNVKARGRNVKARGRNMKARGRNQKARGASVRECVEMEADDIATRAGNALEAAGAMVAGGVAATGMGDVNDAPAVTANTAYGAATGPYAPDYEYTMREGALFTHWGGAEGGGDKWNSGIFDCRDDCGSSCKTLVCCARSVVDQRRFLEGGRDHNWADTKDEICLVLGSLFCCGIPVCRYVLANRQLTRMFFSIEEGDATNPFSGRDLTDKAAMCLFCCANCQQQRQIRAAVDNGEKAPPPQTMTRNESTL